MTFTVGETYEIPLQSGDTVHGKAVDVFEDETAWYVRYDILEYGGRLEDGSPDPKHRYISAEYYYPKTVDTSGIEKGTEMPLEYAGKLYEDFSWQLYPADTAEQRKTIEEYMTNFDSYLRQGLGLYLTSKTRGSGKTMMACCIGNEIIRRKNLRVRFINIADYIQAARNGEAGPYREATVLILDDLGAQDEKHDWINEMVYGLINYRYGNHMPTIFTSNLSIAKCSEDERIQDRVYEMGIEVKMPEVSVRRLLADIKKKEFRESLKKCRA